MVLLQDWSDEAWASTEDALLCDTPPAHCTVRRRGPVLWQCCLHVPVYGLHTDPQGKRPFHFPAGKAGSAVCIHPAHSLRMQLRGAWANRQQTIPLTLGMPARLMDPAEFKRRPLISLSYPSVLVHAHSPLLERRCSHPQSHWPSVQHLGWRSSRPACWHPSS